MAEEYRGKFLAMERDYNMLKHTLEYEKEVEDQEHKNEMQRLHERLRFEQDEADRKVKQIMAESGNHMDNLMRDNHVFQQRMNEEDSLQSQLRNQINQLSRNNNDYLDQIAVIKREKDIEV